MELKQVCGIWYALYRPYVGTNRRCFWSDRSLSMAIAKGMWAIKNNDFPTDNTIEA